VTAATVVGQQLLLARKLYAHTANADDVSLRFQWNRLDILVDDLDFPIWRAQCRQCGQTQRRVDGALVR